MGEICDNLYFRRFVPREFEIPFDLNIHDYTII